MRILQLVKVKDDADLGAQILSILITVFIDCFRILVFGSQFEESVDDVGGLEGYTED